jgi:glycosyltransferase involved in cell wall biosynthesis
MHVLYYHQHFNTRAGSVGTRSYELARRLVSRGHRVTMICGSYAQGSTGLSGEFRGGRRCGTVDGIEVIELKLNYSNRQSFFIRGLTFLRFAARCTWLALWLKYDIVFATTTPLTAGIPGIAARWIRHKPFVFEVRDLWPELPKAMGVITNPIILAAMSALEFASYRSAHRCIGLSPGIVEGIHRRGVDRSRIALVPNGCDLDLFGAQELESWSPPGVEPDDLVAVFTGTHGLANGLDRLLDAAQVLKERGSVGIKLVFVGDGGTKDALVKRAQEQGLDNCVFHQPIPKTKLSQLMKRADVGLMALANIPAFYYGTSPNKFFDYIAAGKPVVNNYPGWVADMITKNGCGIAVAPDNAPALADALQNCQRRRAELPEMGRRGRDLAEREFSRDLLADRWVDTILSVHARA